MATKADRLSIIYCNGYSFYPRESEASAIYAISDPIEEHVCGVSCYKKGKWEAPVTVDPRPKFSITLDLKFLGKCESARLLSILGGLISAGVTTYLYVARKNYRFSVIGAAATGVFVVGYWFFNKWCKRISFNIANKVISTHLNTDQLACNPSQYRL